MSALNSGFSSEAGVEAIPYADKPYGEVAWVCMYVPTTLASRTPPLSAVTFGAGE